MYTFTAMIAVLLACVSVQSAELDCRNLANGVYPNREDCATFYKCSNGYTYLYDCPSNLLFDAPTLQCEWPDLARCAGDDCSRHSAGEFHGVIGCHGHAYGDLYPDPYDCGSFYHCAHGAGGTIEAHHKRCPSILHFNNELKVCDWPEAAGCKECGPDPTDPPTTTTQAPTNAPTTTEAPTHAPTTTQAPTHAPTTTEAPTHAPTTTQAPTQRPTRTPKPTRPPPTKPTRPTHPTHPTHPTDRPTTTSRTTTRRPPGGGSSSEEDSSSSGSSSSEEK